MGSVIDYIDCPNCEHEAYSDFYYKTGEEYINCQNCGYHYSATIKNRNKKLNELTESDWDVKELKAPYGAFKYKMCGDIGTSCGSLKTAEDAERFRIEMKLEYQDHVEFATISRFIDNEIEIEFVIDNEQYKNKL
jgi:DNA-directed RNA polymerase subunit RPC12/RpoP